MGKTMNFIVASSIFLDCWLWGEYENRMICACAQKTLDCLGAQEKCRKHMTRPVFDRTVVGYLQTGSPKVPFFNFQLFLVGHFRNLVSDPGCQCWKWNFLFSAKGLLVKGPNKASQYKESYRLLLSTFPGDITWKGYFELSPMVNQIQ